MLSMTNFRPLALALACATLLAAPALAQGLRPSQQLRPSATPQPAGPRPADYIVVVVNSEPITNNEVRVRMVIVVAPLSSAPRKM